MNIKDYLPYYIGCRVLINDKEYGTLMGGSFVPNSVDQIYYNIITDKAAAEGDDFQMPYNDDTSPECRIKPLLRRLSDMTDQERTEYHKYTKYKTDGVHSVLIKLDTPESFHYLLKQRFDLWGLIDAGLALDSKQLNKEG